MKIDCLLHVHSSFSYDSPTDLADIVKKARAEGYSCILMSEHNNTLDDEQVRAFVARCQALSDERMLVIPGLELSFNQNRVHLLAYGVERFIESMSETCTFQSLVEQIHAENGLAVLAHPSYKQAIDLLTTEELIGLDGIEIWNTRNGNRFCPDSRELRSLARLRRLEQRMIGFGGVDLHYLTKFPRLATRLEVASLSRDHVLAALRAGHFTVSSDWVSVASRGEERRARIWCYDALARPLVWGRRTAYRWQKRIEDRGLVSPRLLVAVGRRLF